MAIFKLGAIVTEIVGSIGGTTFKRQNSSRVMMQKSMGASRSIQLQNRQIANITSIFSRWRNLLPSEQIAWNNLASVVTFPDKFGTMKYLNGRQLFTKQATQSLVIGNNLSYVATTPASGWTVSTVPLIMSSFTFFPLDNEFYVMLDELSANTTICLSFEVSTQPLQAPTYTRRKVEAVYYMTDSNLIDVTDYILTKFPNFNTSMYARVYFYSQNEFFMNSPKQSKDMVISN